MTKAQQLENAVRFAEGIAADNSHGYSNIVDDNLGQHGDYDCGGLISAALQHVGLIKGVFEPNEEYGTPWSWGTILYPAGFKKLPFNYYGVKRGDILIKNGHHVEMATSSYYAVGAHDNYDGKRGDWGTGNEISVQPIPQGYWQYILRLDTGGGADPVSGTYIEYCVQEDLNKAILPVVINDSDYAGIYGSDVIGIAMKLSNGAKIHYQAHLWEGDSEEWYGDPKWLPSVTGYNWNDTENGFAGDARPIDAFTVWTDDKKVEVLYQAHGRKSGKWYEYVSSFDHNIHDEDKGFAGVIGDPIDGIRMKVVLH